MLAINAIGHLVTQIEAMTNDLLRTVVSKYPRKLGSDKKIPLGVVLDSTSIEVIHDHAIDALLNELSYKSPKEYAEAIADLMGINLLECTAIHKYLELKATRDVYVHNRGFANDVYVRKAGLHARVKAGTLVPVDLNYFIESFEQCMQLAEWWEDQLHAKWYSSGFEAKKSSREARAQGGQVAPSDAVSEQLRALAAEFAKSPASDGNS